MSIIPATTTAPVLPRRRQLLFATGFASAAVTIFFLTLIGYYLEARSAAPDGEWLSKGFADGAVPDIIPLTQPNMLLLNLAIGSVMVQWAVYAISRNYRTHAYFALAITALMAVAFINQTTFLWAEIGMTMDSPEGPFFYAVTGSQFALMIGALLFLAVMTFRALGGQYSQTYPDGVSAAAMFWHVNVALYAVMWLAVYILK